MEKEPTIESINRILDRIALRQEESQKKWEQVNAESQKKWERWEQANAKANVESEKKWDELRESQKETDIKLKELGKQIGRAHQERGTYTEILLMPSIKQTLMEVFDYDHFLADVWKNVRHEGIQLDAVGYTNGKRNELMIVEVKTTLRSRDITQLEKNIERFDSFFPEYSGKKKYGMLVSMQADQSMIDEAHHAGFYYYGIEDDLLVPRNPKDFKPKAY